MQFTINKTNFACFKNQSKNATFMFHYRYNKNKLSLFQVRKGLGRYFQQYMKSRKPKAKSKKGTKKANK